MQRITRQDRVLYAIAYAALFLICAVILYPLFFIAIASISDPVLVNTGKIWIVPRGLTLEGYKRIFDHEDILRGYRNCMAYMITGTVLNFSGGKSRA